MIDRRKFNFHLMITVMLLFLFGIALYNQRIILNMDSQLEDLNSKIETLGKAIGIPVSN